MKLIAFVGLCVLHALVTSDILDHERRNTRRESRKLFGGYRITPKYCKPTRKASSRVEGPSICMFNHECSQRNGEVVGACMDGFLFGACCKLPDGTAGELINSYSNLISTPKSHSPWPSPTTPQPYWGASHSDIMLSGMTQITDSLLNDKILPTAQDDAMVQVGDVNEHFSTPGVKHPSPENLIENYDTSNDINPNDFHQISSLIPMEDRKTTNTVEDTTAEYFSASPLIQISISNGPELFTSSPTYLKPMFHNKPSKPNENDKYVLIPTISHTVRPNKTEFNSIVNIIQMLNESSTQNYQKYSTTKKPPSTSYVFSLIPSRRPGYTETSSSKPPSTSYIYSSTVTPRPTSKSPPTRKKTRKPTTKPKPSSSTLYVYPPPTTKPPGYFLYSTYASSDAQTTRKPPSTSYVYSSTITKRPTATANTVSPGYSVYTKDPFVTSSYGSSTTNRPPPTIIVLSPSTETPSSAGSTLYTTSTPQKRRPVAQVTINNHVTHNLYSTEGPHPTVLITPKPTRTTPKPPRRPTTEYVTLPTESETSVNDFINFPPVRNPNLNISSSILDGEITTPTFIEDEELTLKMESFVNKIVEGLQEPFQGLKEVVYKKNSSLFIEQPVKKPTKKPSTTKKPVTRPSNTNTRLTTKKTSTRKPSQQQITTKRPTTTTKKPTPTKKITPSTTISYIDTQTSTFTSDDYRHVCGIRPLVKTGRIVGGKGAQFGEFPWQVLVRESTWLGLFTKNKCGGVLINNRYVMTAAHCQPGFLASLVAVFGEHDISGERESKRAVSRNVKRVIVHRQYDASTFENDLALLELEHPITFDEHIVPICLPREGEDFTGRMATVTGWGRLKYGGGVPSVLQEVQVPIMENHVCQEMFRTAGHSKIIMESFLCAGYANGQKDSCEGDSGGPLVLQRPDGRYQLAGTVSHGIKCAAPYLPGVYMRTAFYKPWIESITGVH